MTTTSAELPDEVKSATVELLETLTAATELAKSAEVARKKFEQENTVLLEKVASLEQQVKSASHKPGMPDVEIQKIIDIIESADLFADQGSTKLASHLRQDPIPALVGLVTHFSGLLSSAPAAGTVIEKLAASKDASEEDPWRNVVRAHQSKQ